MVVETLDTCQNRNMLIAMANAILDHVSDLTEADSQIGDGDHGLGMSRGMKSALEQLQHSDESTNVYDLYKTFGTALMMNMGGASGILFGSLFLAGSKGVHAESLSPRDLAQLFEAGLAAVMQRGKAAVGDKTMVDALFPAVQAMLEFSDSGFFTMLEHSAAAALIGAESTIPLIARTGRAKTLGERSCGHIDAGALSVSIIFHAMLDYLREIEKNC